MIARLRRRHLWMVIALGVLLPIAAAVAIASRPAPTAAGEAEFAAELDEGTANAVLADALSLHRLAAGGGDVLRVTPRRPLVEPDLLLYWTADDADELAEATLLGPVTGTREERLPLPPAATAEAGRVILYSLAHGRVVDSAAWSDVPAASGAGGIR